MPRNTSWISDNFRESGATDHVWSDSLVTPPPTQRTSSLTTDNSSMFDVPVSSNDSRSAAPIQQGSPIRPFPSLAPVTMTQTRGETNSLEAAESHRPRPPPVMYELRRQHRPELWQFVRLIPKSIYADLPQDALRSEHAEAAYCLRCDVKLPFHKGKHRVREHLEQKHAEYLRDHANRLRQIGSAEVVATGLLNNKTDSCFATSDPPAILLSRQSQERLNQKIARWIACSLRPLSVVEDAGFRDVMDFVAAEGGIQVKVMHRTQLKTEICKQAAEQRVKLKAALVRNCDWYSVTTDIWTSRNAVGFISLTVHYITPEMQSQSWTLEVQPFLGKHSGEAIAVRLAQMMQEWGLQPRRCVYLVRDGASNGVLAGNALGVPHMSCIAHSLHLVLAGILFKHHSSKTPAEVDQNSNSCTTSLLLSASGEIESSSEDGSTGPVGTEEWDELLVAGDDDDEIDEEIGRLEEEANKETAEFIQQWLAMEDLNEMRELQRVVEKFRALSIYFHRSAKGWNRLSLVQKELGALQPLKTVTDCATRWSSSRDMLARMVALEDPLAHFFSYLESPQGKEEFTGVKTIARPDPSDWLTIRCLLVFLDPFAAATEFLSGQQYPTLACVFPALKLLRSTLSRSDIFNQELQLVGRQPYVNDVHFRMEAVRRAILRLFDKRFAALPMDIEWILLLDPRFTETDDDTAEATRRDAEQLLFKAALKMAANIAETQTSTRKSDFSPIPDRTPPSKTAKSNFRNGLFRSKLKRARSEQPRAYDTQAIHISCQSEVHRYMEASIQTTPDSDPLLWWQEHAIEFPVLAALARKWLAVVATSVPSERAFSTAGNVITATRNRLAPTLTRDIIFLHENAYPSQL